MPNWCSNTITITGDNKTISGITRLIQSIKKTEGDESRVFETLVGICPNISKDKYENGGWFDSNVSYWGCKWDVSYDDCSPTFNEESIVLYPNTAWSPPIEFCKLMVKEYKKISIHMLYSEGGNNFTGQTDIYLDEDGDVCCEEDDYAYTEGLYFLDIDSFWGEVESTIDSDFDEEEPVTAEIFVDKNFPYVSNEDRKEIIEMYNQVLKQTNGKEIKVQD